MKGLLGILLLLPTVSEAGTTNYGWHACPGPYEYRGRCRSGNIAVEERCPASRYYVSCSHYNYNSVRRRPCACQVGTCRNRNGTCVPCNKCDNCTYRGIELSRENYMYFDSLCEKAICSFRVGIVHRCTSQMPRRVISCGWTRRGGHYPRCCEWVPKPC